ncbi:MAG: serine/threonine-protein kinase [Phycisphaerales bacterium]
MAARGETSPAGSHLESCQRCRELFAAMRANAAFVRGVLPAVKTIRLSGTQSLENAVPGYRISGEIRRGGQGVVYRAAQVATGREVAIKMLLGGALATERQRVRFQIESELAAKLGHPGIVSVLDRIALPGGGYALVMEFVRGVPLGEWEPPGLDAAQRARAVTGLFAKLCGAVHAAHQGGVIHRDLKPSNVIVDEEGNPHVLDFGLARPVGEDRRVTLTGEVACTIAYASPEQIVDPHRVDVRSDVYSLGVMLYEALCGSPPYETRDCSLATAMARVRESPPVPLRAVNGGEWPCRVDRDLELIVAKSLEKDATRRYQSCAALAEDLIAWGVGDPVAARAPSAAYLLSKFVRRHRVPVAAAVVVVVAIVVGGGISVSAAAGTRAAVANAREQAAIGDGARLLLSQLVPATDPGFRTDPDSPARRSLDMFAVRLDVGELADRPAVELAARALIADVYESHSLMAMGLEQRRRVLALRQRISGASDPVTLDAELRLASSLAKADREMVPLRPNPPDWLNEARRVVREAWGSEAQRVASAVLESSAGAGRERFGALEVLGAVAAARGDRGLGLEVERELLAVPPSPGSTDDAVVSETLARLALLREDRAAAAGFAQKSLEVRLRIHTDGEPEVARAILLRGEVGDLLESDPIVRLREGLANGTSLLDQTARIRDLVEVKETILDPSADGPGITASMLRAALMHMRYGEWDHALQRLEACKVRLDASADRVPAGPRICLDLLVEAAVRQGDLEAAEKWSTERVANYRATNETANPNYGRALMDHADIAARRGLIDEAVPRYHEAREVLKLQLDQPSQELLFDMINVRGAALDLLHNVQWGCPGPGQLSPAALGTAEYGLVHAVFRIFGERKRPEQANLAFARPLFLEWGLYRKLGERGLAEARANGLTDVARELEQLLAAPRRAAAEE